MPAGVVVRCRLVGVIEAEQRDADGPPVRNDRLLAVAEPSHRHRLCRSLQDVDPAMLDGLESFFVYYNGQQGRTFRPLGRGGVDQAQRLVQAAQRAWAGQGRNE